MACSQSDRQSVSEEGAGPPNIVLILADDLGYGDIGPYGQELIRTPSLDRLAANGLVFTQHYAGSTVCAPSRASLMTGKHTGRVQIRGNYELGGFYDEHEFGQMPLAGDAVTIAEVLRDAGYATALIGKWGMGGPESEGVPNRQGFDYFFGYLDQKQAHNYYPTHLWRNEQRVELENRFFVPHARQYGGSERASDYRDYMGKDYVPYLMLDEAKSFIRDNRDSPFFLYFSSTIPHSALQIPDEELTIYEGDWPDPPLDGGGYTPHPKPRAARAAMISLLDRQVGEIVKTLAEQGIADNTLVIFTSDNGPAPEGGQDVGFFRSSGELRGIKRDLYEGGIRVPFIAHWPDAVPGGGRSDHVSAFWDMLPTFAALAGADTPPGIDGLSFEPALRGQLAEQEHPYLYWEFHGQPPPGPAQAIRKGAWKLIRFLPPGEPSHVELYNLDDDVSESHDLSESHPEIVEELLALMESAREESPYPGFNFDPEAVPVNEYADR